MNDRDKVQEDWDTFAQEMMDGRVDLIKTTSTVRGEETWAIVILIDERDIVKAVPVGEFFGFDREGTGHARLLRRPDGALDA